MVLANGEQNSELVNLIPESRLPFCTNQFQLPKNDREGLKLVSNKDGFEEMEHEFSFRTFRPEKKGSIFLDPFPPGDFPLKKKQQQQNRDLFTFQQDFPLGGTFVNDTQPDIAI